MEQLPVVKNNGAKDPKVGKKGGKKGGGKKGGGKGKGKGASDFTGPMGSGLGFRLNVKNLASDTDGPKLKALFEPHAKVLDAQVKRDQDGKSLGYGFVVVPAEEDALKAMEALHNTKLGSKALVVFPAERRQPEPGAEGKGAVPNITPAAAAAASMQQQMWLQQAYMQQLTQNFLMQQAMQQAAMYPGYFNSLAAQMQSPFPLGADDSLSPADPEDGAEEFGFAP
eukprot:TRINITY_DN90337_c0_g1_i1.p1 TRINITY_DN90337_c0_g1~~TRINITY_DN90337_c0_g1_i1.p1  ORF type:complete len:225 (-),score=73.54 TRINITY_DN90337_c0_g1_i1:172-846(-)